MIEYFGELNKLSWFNEMALSELFTVFRDGLPQSVLAVFILVVVSYLVIFIVLKKCLDSSLFRPKKNYCYLKA